MEFLDLVKQRQSVRSYDPRVELIVTVGYAAKPEIRTKIRKATAEICRFNGYTGK
jgi:hypothetical protein